MEFIFKVRCLVHRYKEIKYNSIYTVAAIDNLNKKISLIGHSGYFKQHYFSPLEHKKYNTYPNRYRFNHFNDDNLIKYKTVLALVDVGEIIKAGICYEAKPFYYLNKLDDRKIDIFIDGIYHESSSSPFRILNEYESKTCSRKAKIEHLFKEEKE
jgi:hypothetical protein